MNIRQILDKITRLSMAENTGIVQRALKTSEETGELAQAVLSYTDAPGCGYKGKTVMDVAEEAVDVVQVALSIALMFLSEEGVEKMMDKKLEKWKKVQG